VLALAGSLALALLAPPASVAEEQISYQHESEKDFEGQLNAGQIQSVTINKRVRTVRVTLTDGRHFLARYPPHQEPRVAAQLKAKGVSVTVLTKAQAEKQRSAAPVHHKLRYIVGGVLLAVIVIVAVVLLVNRRRRRLED
jgi:ATP-dependent Zn protease